MSNELVVQRQLTPESWGMIQSVANAAYLSRKFGLTEGEAAIKMLFCFENGLPLTAANTGLYIVNGKLAAESNVIAAQIRKHPDYDYRIKRLDDNGCTITILRRDGTDWEEYGESTFTDVDAKKAGLDAKDTYKSYPRNLYFARAITNAARWFCPDIFSQPVYTREELGGDSPEMVEAWATEVKPEAPAITTSETVELEGLVAEYGAAAVLAANGGQIPGTAEDVARVAGVLASGQVSNGS